MSQEQEKKKGLLSSIPPAVRVAIALGVIAILVVLAFFAPPERDASNVTGDLPPDETITVTHPVSTLSVNRGMDFNAVHITVTQVSEAMAFSDDRKRGGSYTVRVGLEEKSTKTGQQTPTGIDYPSLARLVLSDGQVIAPKLVSIAPSVLPNSTQSGYIDFPVDAQVDLSSLAFRMGDVATVPFK